MKRIPLSIFTLLLLAGFAQPLRAQTVDAAESSLTNDDIAKACVSGEVETLPLPFSDLDVNHWAFAAVMNLYYGCFVHKYSAQQQSLEPGDWPDDFSQPDAGDSQVEASELP